MTGSTSTEQRLRAGAAALGLDLSDDQISNLLAYLDLIVKWNKVYNLTAVREPAEMVTHHVLDSLAVVRPLLRESPKAAALLDVGSGAGLPGVVLAICCPSLQVSCVDAVAKKAAFIQNVAVQLRLSNLRGVHSRVETLAGRFDVVCSRAFASLTDFVALTGSLLADGGCWLAMKGHRPEEELAGLPTGVDVFHVEQLHVPGLDAQRCIVWMRPSASAGNGATASHG